MPKMGIKNVLIIVVLAVIAATGIFWVQQKERYLTFQRQLNEANTTTSTPTKTPSPSPVSVSWQSQIPAIKKSLGTVFLDVRVGGITPVSIFEEKDITGDGIPEALVDLGEGGAYTSTLTLMRIEQGKPIPAKFKQRDAKVASLVFLEGSSVRNGESVNLVSDTQVIYSSAWGTDGEGTLNSCEVAAYKWNASTKVFEFNATLSQEIMKDGSCSGE